MSSDSEFVVKCGERDLCRGDTPRGRLSSHTVNKTSANTDLVARASREKSRVNILCWNKLEPDYQTPVSRVEGHKRLAQPTSTVNSK